MFGDTSVIEVKLRWLLAVLACVIAFVSCGGNTKELTPDQKTPGNGGNFGLVPGAEVFAKFSCKYEGPSLGNGPLKSSWALTPIPQCPNLAFRQVGTAFSTHIVKMDVDDERNFYLLLEIREETDQSRYFGRFSLIKLAPTGKQEFEIKATDDGIFESFALHPSGDVTVVETRKAGQGDELSPYHVWFRRLDKNGNLKLEAPLRDPSATKNDGGLAQTMFYAGSNVVSNGEEIYLSSFTDKGKLYSLTLDYQVKWSYLHQPNGRVIIGPGDVEMFVDKDARLVMAESVTSDDLAALESKLGEPIPDKSGGAIVYRFSPDGKKVEHKILHHSNYLSVAGIHADSDTVTIAGDVRLKKFNEPNHTHEHDLVFIKFDMGTGAILANRIIDLKRDDSASGLAIDRGGNSYIVGRNNFVQVDSHSVVENGQAFILKLNPNGETLQYLSFNGPRDTGLNSVVIKQGETNEELFISGHFDSPITHTADQDRSLGYVKAMIGKFAL